MGCVRELIQVRKCVYPNDDGSHHKISKLERNNVYCHISSARE